MHSSRSILDSTIYWGVFVFIACFVAYFLTSAISLQSNDELESVNSARTISSQQKLMSRDSKEFKTVLMTRPINDEDYERMSHQ